MRTRSLLTSAGSLLMLRYLGPGTVSALAERPMCANTCIAVITAPRQGVHTARATIADGVLWPPNHRFRTISVSATDADGQPCDVTIGNVRQDEPVKGHGDHTGRDAAHCDNGANHAPQGNTATIRLRAERLGKGDGRFYHVSFTMRDTACPDAPAQLGEAKVLVPHDQGVGKIAIDEGPLFESAAPSVQCRSS